MLAGFLMKIDLNKSPNRVDDSAFKSPEFESRWLNQVPGKELGIRVSVLSLKKIIFTIWFLSLTKNALVMSNKLFF